VPDHLAGLFAPMPALISAAEATKNLRIGTNVLNNDFRHPVLVAREAATVDLLTEGRLELGLGAGHMQSEYRQAGSHSAAVARPRTFQDGECQKSTSEWTSYEVQLATDTNGSS
jgi:alkanesulfonate monooxygenase SsuD/methylene tetrahydromethanopterin reductase-like flavin-dependent oxidoreductase (luciferase family)